MDTDGVVAFATVVYALRWLLVALGFLLLGSVLAVTITRARFWEKHAIAWEDWAEGLEQENTQLRDLIRPDIIALPPRKGTETSHG